MGRLEDIIFLVGVETIFVVLFNLDGSENN